MDNVFYFQFPKIATVCIKKVGPTQYEFAVAYCSPKDEFTKKAGRELAYSRMLNGNTTTFWRCKNYYNKAQLKMDVAIILHTLTGNRKFLAFY